MPAVNLDLDAIIDEASANCTPDETDAEHAAHDTGGQPRPGAGLGDIFSNPAFREAAKAVLITMLTKLMEQLGGGGGFNFQTTKPATPGTTADPGTTPEG